MWKAGPTRPSSSSTALLNRGRPISASVGDGNSHQQGRTAGQGAGHPGQRVAAVPHETGAQQQVARKVSHQRQLGGDHQFGIQLPGPRGAFENPLGIAGQVAGGCVDLEQSDAQRDNRQSRLSQVARLELC